MKLNPDCIRDILLTVEDSSDFNHCTEYSQDDMKFERLVPYTHEEITYHIRQCELSHLIQGVRYFDNGETITILDLTPNGHQFISNIHSDTIWSNVKDISKKVGSKSLNSITQIATGVISEIIKSQLKLS